MGGSHPHDAHAARRAFDAHDHGRSGYLGVNELLRVAEEVFRAGHPHEPALSSERKEVRRPGPNPLDNLGAACLQWAELGASVRSGEKLR